MANTSRPSIIARDGNVIAGILKRLQNVPSIVLGGVSYTPTTLVALFQSHIDSAKKVESDKGQWQTSVQSFRALTTKVDNALSGLRELVRQMFNNAPDALSDFGFAPKKAAKKSAVKKVVATVKNRATRTARHTQGPKKKLETKGVVTASEVAAAVAAAIGPETSVPVGSPPPVANVPPPAPAPAVAGGSSGSTGSGSTASGSGTSGASGNGAPPAAPVGGPGNGPHA